MVAAIDTGKQRPQLGHRRARRLVFADGNTERQVPVAFCDHETALGE